MNGPRNKLWDADVANWPKVIDKAAALEPKTVLPGHGAAGSKEILTGQAQYLRDLYSAVVAEVKQGRSLAQAEREIKLPVSDANWVRDNLTQPVRIVWSEIKAGKPAGSLPHPWK